MPCPVANRRLQTPFTRQTKHCDTFKSDREQLQGTRQDPQHGSVLRRGCDIDLQLR